MTEAVVREVAAVAAAVGVAALLLPARRWATPREDVVRRAAGLALMLVAWAVLAASLVPADDARSAADRLAGPLALAAVVGLAAAIVVVVALVRLVLARPWTWFAMLAVALPVRFPVSLGSQRANLLVPLYAVVLIGLAAWVWGRRRGMLPVERERGGPLDLPLAAFAAFVLISTIWSDDSTQAAVKAVFFWLPFVLLYRLVVAWWPMGRALRTLALTTIAMAVPIAVLALGQYATREVFWNHRLQQANVYSRFFRANGIFYDPNILGRYLVLAILAALGIAWLARGRREVWWLLGACAVMGAGLAVTFSRSSALGLMVGLPLLAWRAFGGRRTLAVGGAVAVVLALGALALNGNVRRVVTSTDRLERVSEGRFDLVRGGLSIWRDDPVQGAGLGSFERRYSERLTPGEQRRVRTLISHNAPVTVLSEVGAVGFALFLALLITAAAVIARSSRAPDPEGWAAWVALTMLAAILVHSLLYSALFEDPYTWVVAGAALGLAGAGRPRETPTPAPMPPEPVPV